MRSLIAALRTLVLPFGTTTGQRIVLDGVNGRIDMYDTNNIHVLAMTGTSGGLTILPDATDGRDWIQLASDTSNDHAVLFFGKEGTPEVEIAGRIHLSTLGLYTSTLGIAAPLQDGAADQAQLIMASEDLDGGVPPTWRFRDNAVPTDILQIDGGAESNLWFDHGNVNIPRLSMGRGLVDTTGQIDVPEGPYTADATSADFVLTNVPVVAGREYLFLVNGLGELSGATGAWQLNLLLNGAYVGTFTRITNQGIGPFRHSLFGMVSWIAPTTQATDDFAIQFDERTGTADLTVIGGLTATDPPRIFSVYDMGEP